MHPQMSRDDVEQAVRRKTRSRDRDIGYLLGDPQRDIALTIEEWVAAAQNSRSERFEAATTGQFSLMEISYESACALVHDARPREAREVFQMILVPEHRASPTKVLVQLGLGRALNMWRRYASAETMLSKALADAVSLGDPILEVVARTLWTVNRSDAGTSVDLEALLDAPIDGRATGVAPLIDAMRAYAASRVYLRAGRRVEGIRMLEAVVAAPTFGALAMVPRGLVLRMSGVLHSVSGQSALAAERLKQAISVFRQAGYVSGEVHAAFSLARLNAPVDRQEMAVYLGRAQEILEHTDDDTAPPRPGARQMPGERAELLSRLAEHEFQNGHLQKALAYYEQDLRATSTLSDVPRSLGYAERNVGRILLAMRRPVEAIKHLETSQAMFLRVQDAINVFFTLDLLGEAYVQTQAFEKAEGIVNRMCAILEGKPGREKEHCIVDVLRAQVLWKHQLESERALGVITASCAGLRRVDTDYYYVRALIVEGALLIDTGDRVSARWPLKRARRYSVSRQLDDLRQKAEELLNELGPEPIQHREIGRTNRAILYSDLRGFTSVCQVIDTAVMAEFIREFAEMIGREVTRYDGEPMRFLGDCVMAVFGPHDTPYPKERLALEAACAIHDGFKKQRHRWGARQPELADIGIGFGLSTGMVVADRFGSEDLSEYSMIGEAVNLAARLQGWAADEEILVTEQAYARLTQSIPDLPATPRACQLRGYRQSEVTAHVVHAPSVWPRVQRERRARD